jgi:UDP-2,3-diacylglucosamine pyrophosphatase LpxH
MALQRQVYVISDLHLGGEYGDSARSPHDRGFRICTHVREAAAFVDSLADFAPAPVRTELVINGDVVDFLAEDRGDTATWTSFIADGDEAAATFRTIAARDRAFFDALGRFLGRGHRLVVLLGNHDVELSLPAVRREFCRAIGATPVHDLEFVDGAEAYIVGDALIEHGNRYDEWNVVDHAGIMRLRAFQSRRQFVPRDREVEICAGSQMVSTVINPVKTQFRFVDLLKPEIDAVIPILLAVAPESRSYLTTIATHRRQAATHRLPAPALPARQDIAASPSVVDPLLAVLARPLKGDVERFLAELGEKASTIGPAGANRDGDIASWGDRGRQAVGLTRLLLPRVRPQTLEDRLPALLMALRVLRTDDSFNRHVESLSEYANASRELARHGFKFVIFGHTHLARDVDLGGGGRYLNSGTWADLLEVPREIVSGSWTEALADLRDYAADLAANRLDHLVRFTPTYVRLHVSDDGAVVEGTLRDYVAGVEP